jgi:hypothetical protein
MFSVKPIVEQTEKTAPPPKVIQVLIDANSAESLKAAGIRVAT